MSQGNDISIDALESLKSAYTETQQVILNRRSIRWGFRFLAGFLKW